MTHQLTITFDADFLERRPSQSSPSANSKGRFTNRGQYWVEQLNAPEGCLRLKKRIHLTFNFDDICPAPGTGTLKSEAHNPKFFDQKGGQKVPLGDNKDFTKTVIFLMSNFILCMRKMNQVKCACSWRYLLYPLSGNLLRRLSSVLMGP